MARIEVRGLIKEYDGGRRAPPVRAVDGIDLVAADGEHLVLLGPSGCGKTTLLRTIAGLETPTAGDVLIDGEVVTGLPPRARNVAMVFQSYALYPHKSVRANITFPLKAAGVPRPERDRQAEAAAASLDLTRLLDRRPRQLSGGERQRVALARALVRDPRVFLLDEPLSNLDAKLRASAREELKRFQQEIGTTTVYVTHDQVEAMALGDQIAVLCDGRVRQVGTPDEVYDEPADTFVATFLGSPPMNLVRRDDELVGFRPEHLLPPEATAGTDLLVLSLAVERVERLSGDRHVLGTATGIGEPTRVVARLPATLDVDPRPGDDLALAVEHRRVRRFDAANGRALAGAGAAAGGSGS
jgi:multiple sugar transport system ATP-binding protein